MNLVDNYFEKQGLTARENMELETLISLLEETGEVIGVVKKLQFHQHRNKEELKIKLEEEIGDLIWYLTQYSKENNSTEIWKDSLKTYLLLTELNLDDNENIDKSMFLLSKNLMKRMLEIVEDEFKLKHFFRKSFNEILTAITFLISFYKLSSLESILEKNIEKLSKRYKKRIAEKK